MASTSDEDLFLHGGSYTENGKVRPSPCQSCAFVSTPETVRPAHISISELEEMSADYDDFMCHCLDAEGRAFSCAGWHARFGRQAPAQN